MTYSIIGILAAIILVIINKDVLWGDDEHNQSVTRRNYRNFLKGVMGYYVTDVLWGVLESHRLTAVLYVDTAVHFVAMALAILFWTRYVVSYLEDKSFFGALLNRAGTLFLCFEIAVVSLNFVRPVLFWFDEAGAYHAGVARYITLMLQILMFFLCSIYTLRLTSRTQGTTRRRNLTIGLFGVVMIILIGVQVAYPLLPYYAMGYMLGTCLLHSYVVEDEKNEYRLELEESLKRERRQREKIHASGEALKDALATAEGANKAKTPFITNMSHDIRTPMNAIIGLYSFALADPTISDSTRRNLQMVDTSAHHLLGIINDILDMSRIESGRMVVKREEFSLMHVLDQVNAIIGGQCNDKGLHYECRVPSDMCNYCIGDDQKLRQALINVLGNAVKFTPEGGSVTLAVQMTMRYEGKVTLRFTMTDTGIGMSEDYLPKIFESFSQEDSSAVNAYGSTGLGMPITKNIVELMGGTIDVKSKKGQGSTFIITLTFAESSRQKDSDDEEFDVQSLRILVIDDDNIACEHAKLVFGQVGIACDRVLSGDEALDVVRMHRARREPYDLILVDRKMPGMDGIETVRRIREDDGEQEPVIILTTYSWEDIIDEARMAGVDAFVAKPLLTERVLDEFKKVRSRKNNHTAELKIDLAGRRVLLAEDVDVNAEIMEMLLSMRDMEVERAENGRVAVEMFAGHDQRYYDAILMDMRMPEMNGLDATRAIRTLDRADAPTIPIIALTANAFDEDVRHSMQAGLNAHLSKPVEPEALFRTLEDLIAVQCLTAMGNRPE